MGAPSTYKQHLSSLSSNFLSLIFSTTFERVQLLLASYAPPNLLSFPTVLIIEISLLTITLTFSPHYAHHPDLICLLELIPIDIHFIIAQALLPFLLRILHLMQWYNHQYQILVDLTFILRVF